MNEAETTRRRLGMSNARFARAMGVNPGTSLKWERGERKPGAAAIRLMRVLVLLQELGVLDKFLAMLESKSA